MPSIQPVLQLAYRILPPTIHPMILHFPIALLYLTAGIDILATFTEDRDRFLQRAGFWTLSLAAFFTLVTMAAGLVSEHAVHLAPPVLALLARHRMFAVLTGSLEGLAWLVRVSRRYPRPRRQGWSLFGTGRGRGDWFSTLIVVAAAASITITASIGGQLVYDHGAGVLGVTRGVTAGAVRGAAAGSGAVAGPVRPPA